MVCGALPGGPANSRSDQLKANAAAGERDVLSSSYRDVRWLTEDDVVQLSPAEILSLLNSCIKKLGKTARMPVCCAMPAWQPYVRVSAPSVLVMLSHDTTSSILCKDAFWRRQSPSGSRVCRSGFEEVQNAVSQCPHQGKGLIQKGVAIS